MKTTLRPPPPLALCGMVFAISCLLTRVGLAEPLTLTLDTDQSSLDLWTEFMGILHPSGTIGLSGTIDADLQIAEAGGVSEFEAFEVAEGTIYFSDEVMTDTWLGNTLTVETHDIIATVWGGPVAGSSGPTNYTFDLTGFNFDLIHGSMYFLGSGWAIGEIDQWLIFDMLPLEIDLSSPTDMSVVATDLGGDNFDIQVTIPIDESLLLGTEYTGLDEDVPYTLNGQIVANGVLYVPEPSALLLLCCGVAGLALLHRFRA